MKSLLNMIKKPVAHIASEYAEYRTYHQAYKRDHSRTEFTLLFILASLRNAQANYRCRTQGHKFEDYGDAGPESGVIDVQCTRCGYSDHTQLY